VFLAFQSPLIGSRALRPDPHNTPMNVILILDFDQARTIAYPTAVRKKIDP